MKTKHQVHIDIVSDNSTLEKIKKFLKVDDIYKYIVENTEYFKYAESDCSILTTIDNIKINDVIHVKYIPCSQKYIDYYDQQDIKGRVVYIDKENDDAILYHDISVFDVDTNEKTIHTYIMSIKRQGCGYYGDDCYYKSIYVDT